MNYTDVIRVFDKGIQKRTDSEHTRIAYRKDVEQFLKTMEVKNILTISHVTTEHIASYINSLVEKGYTKKSASRKLNSVRTFFKIIKTEGIVTHNPSLEVTHPKFEPNPPRILSKLEYSGLREVARPDHRAAAIIETILQTGIKISELSDLKDTDYDGSHIYLDNKKRIISVGEQLKQSLDVYKKKRGESPSGYLFVTRVGKKLLIRNIRHIVDKYFAEIGIQDATVNDLRNTFIAHQLAHGMNASQISTIVGHKRITSTEKFLSVVPSLRDKVLKIKEL